MGATKLEKNGLFTECNLLLFFLLLLELNYILNNILKSEDSLLLKQQTLGTIISTSDKSFQYTLVRDNINRKKSRENWPSQIDVEVVV